MINTDKMDIREMLSFTAEGKDYLNLLAEDGISDVNFIVGSLLSENEQLKFDEETLFGNLGEAQDMLTETEQAFRAYKIKAGMFVAAVTIGLCVNAYQKSPKAKAFVRGLFDKNKRLAEEMTDEETDASSFVKPRFDRGESDVEKE